MRSTLLLLFFLCALGKAQDTLPPLVDGKIPTTLDELWGDYNPRNEPIEGKVIREWEEDDVILKYITYTIGTFKGQKSTMSAIYGYPKGQKDLPAFLHIHGGGGRASLDDVKWGAWNGYAVLSVNWGGHPPLQDLKDDEPNTDWGALDATQTGHNSHYSLMTPDEKTLDSIESPRNNNWFLLVLGCRRGITYLEQQPEVDPERIGVTGHSMGGKLTVNVSSIDKRVKAAAPSCGGTGAASKSLSGMPGAGAKRDKSELYLNTIDDIPYLKKLSCPLIFVSATNDFAGPMDNMYINQQYAENDFFRYAMSPHFNHRHNDEFYINTLLIFDQFLKNSFTYPEQPTVTINLKGDIPEVKVVADPAFPIEKVDIYYSIDPHILSRFWRDAQAEKQDNSWTAQCPIMSTEHPLFVFANVTYKKDLSGHLLPRTRQPYENMFGLSSNMLRIMPEELAKAGIKATDKPDRLIEDFKRGWHDWHQLNWGNPYHWVAGTRKMKDPKHRAPKGAQLAIDVKSPEDNTLAFYFNSNEWGAYEGQQQRTYIVKKEIKGSPEWQTVTLSESDLVLSSLPRWKTDNEPTPTWQYVTEFGLKSKGAVVKDGHLHPFENPWKGEINFRDLRWVGGTYPETLEVSGGVLELDEKELDGKIKDAIDESWKK